MAITENMRAALATLTRAEVLVLEDSLQQVLPMTVDFTSKDPAGLENLPAEFHAMNLKEMAEVYENLTAIHDEKALGMAEEDFNTYNTIYLATLKEAASRVMVYIYLAEAERELA